MISLEKIAQFITNEHGIFEATIIVLTIIFTFFGIINYSYNILKQHQDIKNTDFKRKNYLKRIKSITPYGIIIRLYHYLIVEKPIKLFYQNYFKEEFYIVIPPKDVDTIRHGTQNLDFIGAMEIQEMFTNIGISVKRVTSKNISENEKKNNLLLVGGPIPNCLVESLFDSKEIVYKFGGENGHSIINNKKLEMSPQIEEGQKKYDLGIITRMKNPYNTDNDIIIACGAFGWGTQAALRILKDKDSLEYLNGSYQHFQVLCMCEIDKAGVSLKPYLLDLCPDESLKYNSIVNLS